MYGTPSLLRQEFVKREIGEFCERAVNGFYTRSSHLLMGGDSLIAKPNIAGDQKRDGKNPWGAKPRL